VCVSLPVQRTAYAGESGVAVYCAIAAGLQKYSSHALRGQAPAGTVQLPYSVDDSGVSACRRASVCSTGGHCDGGVYAGRRKVGHAVAMGAVMRHIMRSMSVYRPAADCRQ
jgi:hypothetical protein